MFVVGGESLIDLVPKPQKQDGVILMEAHQGGSPYNCAIALARLGNQSGFLCPVSQDGFGDYLAAPLQKAGVRLLLSERVKEPTSLAVVSLNERGQAQYQFYRAADRAFDIDKMILSLPQNLKLYQIGGFCAIEPNDAQIWEQVARAALQKGATLSIDPNIRPSLVTDFAAYKQRLNRFFDLVHLIKLSLEDLEALDNSKSVDQHVEELLARPNCRLVIVTDGENGSKAFTASASASAEIYRPPVFGDTVGAGDALMAGVLTILFELDFLAANRLGQLDQTSLKEVLRFGAVVAGLNCRQKGSHPASRAEVDKVLANSANQPEDGAR
ncbi:Fructokinase [hydrothermal vent metagenome]|uniref:Fructokinase n=1 Tax=hydrothermal vent metagenome TaxID=652676 RepID=A0A3B0UT42_9ZZZZ